MKEIKSETKNNVTSCESKKSVNILKSWWIWLGVIIIISNAIGDSNAPKEPIPVGEEISVDEQLEVGEVIKQQESYEDDGKLNIDWDECISETKKSITNIEFYPFVKDVLIQVNEEEKRITISVVVGDATKPSVALEYADTVIRQLNLFANMQDSSIQLGSKDYYGGIYDQYSLLIGITPFSKVDNHEEWFIFDAVAKKAHTKIKLQKKYR